jgi:hypothetical protein
MDTEPPQRRAHERMVQVFEIADAKRFFEDNVSIIGNRNYKVLPHSLKYKTFSKWRLVSSKESS